VIGAQTAPRCEQVAVVVEVGQALQGVPAERHVGVETTRLWEESGSARTRAGRLVFIGGPTGPSVPYETDSAT